MRFLGSFLLGIASMLLAVTWSQWLGLEHTWMPGGLVAYVLTFTTTWLLWEDR